VGVYCAWSSKLAVGFEVHHGESVIEVICLDNMMALRATTSICMQRVHYHIRVQVALLVFIILSTFESRVSAEPSTI